MDMRRQLRHSRNTMSDVGFFLNYPVFWIVNYGLAIVIWSCVGRFLLAFFVPSMQPSNYIWRAFVALTEWALIAVRYITPGFVRPFMLAPIAAFWLFHIRVVAFLIMWRWGLVPPIGAGG
jgi:hypothetical protein